MRALNHFDVVIVGGGIAGLHLASSCLAGGLKVAVVDAGADSSRFKEDARPRLVCNGRQHEGSSIARNHVVGGNAHYWGGAMARNRPGELAVLTGESAGMAAGLDAFYDPVDRMYGIPPASPRQPASAYGLADEWALAEVMVLMGRQRNVSVPLLSDLLRNPAGKLFSGSRVCAVKRQGQRISALVVRTPAEGEVELHGKQFVISTGTIDSNLFCLRFARELQIERFDLLGRCLHDHWSLPVFNVRMESAARFGRDLGPRFRDGLTVARRLEVQNREDGWNPSAFLHFQYYLEQASPWRELKSLLELRQRGGSVSEYLQTAPALLSKLPSLVRIGWERFVHGRLYLSGAVPVVATLDFESCPLPQNRLCLGRSENGEETATLDWSFADSDARAFAGLLNQVEEAMSALSRKYGLEFSPVEQMKKCHSAREYARAFARDAYHLGGGVPAGPDAGTAIIRPDLRFHSVENVSMLSAAAFRRPGIANPTLSLLALGRRLSGQLISCAG